MKKLLTLFAFALVTLTANAQEDIHLSCSDGDVNVVDIMMTVNAILGNTLDSFHVENADVNNDNTVNILDVMGIVNIVLHHVPN